MAANALHSPAEPALVPHAPGPCKCGGTCPACRQRQAILRRRAATSRSAAPLPGDAEALLAPLGPGRALDPALRASLERGFGRDLEPVRIHTGARAAASAREVDALAYSIGDHVVFGENRYAPTTSTGMSLLAHEIAHTVQTRDRRAPPRLMRKKTKSDDETECADIDHTIKKIVVDQDHEESHGEVTKTQKVTITWSDGTTESSICSTGKGHCCLDSPAASGGVTGAACSETGSTKGGSNCTPLGIFDVAKRLRRKDSGVDFWTEFQDPRDIALHSYPRIDGSPLSHGCVRMPTDFARRIWCGSREGQTKVHVVNLARPRCDNPMLQSEWLRDFKEASRPLDGETLSAEALGNARRTRAQLRSALDVTDPELTERLSRIREAVSVKPGGGFPAMRGNGPVLEAVAVVPAIPRCLPSLTSEESRLDAGATASTPSAPQQMLSASGFAQNVRAFGKAFTASKSLDAARKLVSDQGHALWKAARDRAQGKTADADDRPLYWSRLAITRILRDTGRNATPAWLESQNPDEDRRIRAQLLDSFERSSRGLDTAAFRDEKGVKRVVISGFDPFALDTDIRRSNPSGAAVLALDGQVLTAASGERARVEGAIFPVRFVDFNAEIVERFMGPFITGKTPPNMIVTISMGGSQVEELEEYAGRRRSSGRFSDNLRRFSGGWKDDPFEPAGLTPGAEFLPTTTTQATRAAMRVAARGSGAAIPEETTVVARDPKSRAADKTTEMPGAQAIKEKRIAVEGAGGGYLSNEIFYRTLLALGGKEIPMIHLHTRLLKFEEGWNEARFSAARDAIVQMVRKILEAALPTI